MDLEYDAVFEAVHGFPSDWRDAEEEYPHTNPTPDPEEQVWDDLCWNPPEHVAFWNL